MKKYPFLTKEILQKEYDELKSFKLIAEKYSIPSTTVESYIKGFKIETVPKLRYSFHENIFETDTEISLYLAGYIAADAAILHRSRDGSKVLNICSSAKDRDYFDLIKGLLGYNGPTRSYVNKNSKRNPNWKDAPYQRIDIYSKKLVEDLDNRFGIGPRKSLTYKFPDRLVDSPLVNHFMRGYFDGDGCFHLGHDSHNDKQRVRCLFSLRGSVDFLMVYQNILNENCGLISKTTPKTYSYCRIGNLRFMGKDDAKKISHFLYKNANVMMQRKFDVVSNFYGEL